MKFEGQCYFFKCLLNFSNLQFIFLLSLADISIQFWSKYHKLLSPAPGPASSLVPFLGLPYSLNWIWPCSVESSLLQWRMPPHSCYLPTKKVWSKHRGRGSSTADVPWVLRMRHIEPFHFSLQLGRPCSHCSGHIHMYFSAVFHFPFFSNRCFWSQYWFRPCFYMNRTW